jgi:hypothetical protein
VLTKIDSRQCRNTEKLVRNLSTSRTSMPKGKIQKGMCWKKSILIGWYFISSTSYEVLILGRRYTHYNACLTSIDRDWCCLIWICTGCILVKNNLMNLKVNSLDPDQTAPICKLIWNLHCFAHAIKVYLWIEGLILSIMCLYRIILLHKFMSAWIYYFPFLHEIIFAHKLKWYTVVCCKLVNLNNFLVSNENQLI